MKKIKGFTLVELMVVVIIMGIMAAVAMPSMNAFVAKSRINNRAEQIASLFRYAKGEAIRMNKAIIICGNAIRSDGRPSGNCNKDNYSSGLKAFADMNRTGAYEADTDQNIRTIAINGNGAGDKVKVEVDYFNLQKTKDDKPKNGQGEFVFLQNGRFGLKDQGNVTLSSHYVRIKLMDAENEKNTSRHRYVIISPSGSTMTCPAGSDKDTKLCKAA
ncbi:MAG: GspH/FimT family pseudopilin [Alysiella sp.]|uniref:GspH/FimT family pseudopilin n=1 Tax=Alysiella sp. TaxID=1872483 RepID=UPI0026DB0A9C|nr:GspH/FimT family pseudopilin [Alysiella sp.]MDO4433499.1 GspH/FimT family pseudopilin [Alysiella sp.]